MADEFAVFTVDRARFLNEVVDALVKGGYIPLAGRKRPLLPLDSVRKVPIRALTALTAYSCVEIDASVDSADDPYPVVAANSGIFGTYFFTTSDLEADEVGTAQVGPVFRTKAITGSGGFYAKPTGSSGELVKTTDFGPFVIVSDDPGLVMYNYGFDIKWADSKLQKAEHGFAWSDVIGGTTCPP